MNKKFFGLRNLKKPALIICLFIWFGMPVMAQLPLPPLPFPDPLGIFGGSGSEGEQAVTQVVSFGMERKPAGEPPYGRTPSGDPYWPIPEPAPAKLNQGNTEPPKPQPAQVISPSSSGSVTNEKHNETINTLPAGSSFEGKNISPVINRNLIAGSRSGLPGRPAERLSDKEVEALQYAFIHDLQRRARYIYEGKNAMAAAVSCKWKLIGSLHANQIDDITFNIADKNNFPKFSMWIESVVEQDIRQAENP